MKIIRYFIKIGISVLIFFTAALIFSHHAVQANTYTVTTTADTNDGVCNTQCSLREAVAVANGNPGADTIDLPAGTYSLGASGRLSVSGSLAIIGSGSDVTIINAPSSDRIFNVTTNAVLSLDGMTLQGGNTDYGGAISCLGGEISLSDITLSGNHATTSGGAISLNDCTLTMVDSSITGNSATSNGGAIYAYRSGWTKNITLTNSIISGNTSISLGGGVYISNNNLILKDTTISGNQASSGGGIYLTGSLSTLKISSSLLSGNSVESSGAGIYLDQATSAIIENSTISGNAADDYAGGIYAKTPLTLSLDTITANIADADNNEFYSRYGGLYLFVGGTVTLKNTILAGNLDLGTTLDDKDCYRGISTATIIADWYNLAQSIGNCNFFGTDIVATAPMLGVLQDNGGPTLTHALLAGSPAINAGHAGFTPPPYYDQRGHPRVKFGRVDIGAFEWGSVLFLPLVAK